MCGFKPHCKPSQHANFHTACKRPHRIVCAKIYTHRATDRKCRQPLRPARNAHVLRARAIRHDTKRPFQHTFYNCGRLTSNAQARAHFCAQAATADEMRPAACRSPPSHRAGGDAKRPPPLPPMHHHHHHQHQPQHCFLAALVNVFFSVSAGRRVPRHPFRGASSIYVRFYYPTDTATRSSQRSAVIILIIAST